MAFVIQEPKTVTQWLEYEDGAEFEVRGIAYPKYQVEIDRMNRVYDRLECVTYDGQELTHHQAILLAIVRHLIVGWKGVAIKQNGEVKNVPYTEEIAFNIMRWCTDLTGATLAGWVLGKASDIQHEADTFKAEVLGKSENSTSGQNTTTQTKKPRKTNGSTAG